MVLLRVEGEVEAPRSFGFAELAALPGQVPDVGTLIPGRQGGGVWLRSLLDAVGQREAATYVTLTATDGLFSASVPLAAIADHAVVVYRLGQATLPTTQGGPVRFYITRLEEGTTSEVNACANVKSLGVIRLTIGPGEDTRLAR